MALYFVDTSALVKLYVRERGTDPMLAIAAPASGNQLTILSLAQVELRSAIRRRERAGDIASGTADRILELFQLHLQSRFTVQPVTHDLLELAADLVDRRYLRALDALQLAGCLTLVNSSLQSSPVFVSGDRELLAAAIAENAAVFDPIS